MKEAWTRQSFFLWSNKNLPQRPPMSKWATTSATVFSSCWSTTPWCRSNRQLSSPRSNTSGPLPSSVSIKTTLRRSSKRRSKGGQNDDVTPRKSPTKSSLRKIFTGGTTLDKACQSQKELDWGRRKNPPRAMRSHFRPSSSSQEALLGSILQLDLNRIRIRFSERLMNCLIPWKQCTNNQWRKATLSSWYMKIRIIIQLPRQP